MIRIKDMYQLNIIGMANLKELQRAIGHSCVQQLKQPYGMHSKGNAPQWGTTSKGCVPTEWYRH